MVSAAAQGRPLKHDLFAMGLVGSAHGMSHFYQLVLPPLFPFLILDFELTYTELGFLMTTFFVASGFGQPAAGFVVDRFGAQRVLMAGLGLYSLAIGALALAPTFSMMFPLVVLAGIGNSVFHPADFTLLNANVRASYLGRAFGVHTLGGNLGWALAPAFMVVLAVPFGWRGALAGAAMLGLAVWLLLWWHRDAFRGEACPASTPGASMQLNLGTLFAPAIVLCFGYFLLLAAALIAVQNFLPAILGSLHQTPPVLAGTALTGFLLGAAAGVLGGGFLADHSHRHTLLIAGGLLGAATLLLSVAHVAFTATALVLVVSGAGFLSGVTTPSRDLVVRAAAPPGATGRVFGVVYSGLDVGSALAPITVGWMLDHGRPQWALWIVAAVIVAAVFTIVGVRSAASHNAPAAT